MANSVCRLNFVVVLPNLTPKNQRTASTSLPRSLVPLVLHESKGERTVEDSGRRRVTLARRPWPQNYPKCSIIEVFSRCRTRVTRSSLANFPPNFHHVRESKKEIYISLEGYDFPPALPMNFLYCAREGLVELLGPLYSRKHYVES